jgi:hypothetical protein
MAGLYQGGFLGAAVLTGVVIVASTREGTGVAWLLSRRPMLWLGARSYSLYLWHWPVVVWLKPSSQADALELTGVNAARLALTLVCAEASYRWVEKPWTTGARAAWGRRTWIGLGALVLLNLVVLSFIQPLGRTAPTEPNALTLHADSQVANPRTAKATTEPSKSATALAPNPAGAAYQQVTLVGDSVLLGASPYLLRHLPAARVDAKVGRQGSDGLKLVQSLRDEAQLGDAAVIHLGTNGYLGEKQFRALLEQLADRKTVVVLNVYGARRWTGPNNDMIARVSQGFDNVRMVDWHAMGQSNPAYFVPDGIHLSGSGIRAYYNQIRIALGQPEGVPPGPATGAVKRPPQRPSTGAQPTTSPAPTAIPSGSLAPSTPGTANTPSTQNPAPNQAAPAPEN